MILDKFIKIRVHTITHKHYNDLGYVSKPGDEININVEHLTNSSKVKLNVQCDICGEVKILSCEKYNKNINKHGIYSCSIKCSQLKIKKTKLEKYGDENYNNREKCVETCLEKYGFENPQQNKIIKEKSLETVKNKYGDSILMNNEELKNKVKSTKIKKYGVGYGHKVLEKSKKTMIERYGDENYNNREKSVKTCLEKYGVENPLQNDIIKEKGHQTRVNNGTYLNKNQRSDFKNYWLKVQSITNQNKQKLFSSWDGTDYYDNEYIKDNFILKCTDKKYPTIDHKTSVFYGFLNNITEEIIGGLENLCITKRSINSSKSIKCR